MCGRSCSTADLIQQALREAVTEALIRHKRLGNPIVVWRDGKVVWVPADEIEIPEPGTGEGGTDNPRETVKG